MTTEKEHIAGSLGCNMPCVVGPGQEVSSKPAQLPFCIAFTVHVPFLLHCAYTVSQSFPPSSHSLHQCYQTLLQRKGMGYLLLYNNKVTDSYITSPAPAADWHCLGDLQSYTLPLCRIIGAEGAGLLGFLSTNILRTTCNAPTEGPNTDGLDCCPLLESSCSFESTLTLSSVTSFSVFSSKEFSATMSDFMAKITTMIADSTELLFIFLYG